MKPISPGALWLDGIFPGLGAVLFERAELAPGGKDLFNPSPCIAYPKNRGGDAIVNSIVRCSRNALCLGNRNLKALLAQTDLIYQYLQFAS